YIRSNLQYKVEIPKFTDASCIVIKFSPNVAIIALYRSPSYEDIKPFLHFSFLMHLIDPNFIADTLVNLISTIITNHSHLVPIPSRKRIIKPWITPGLLKCIRHRDNLYRKFKRNPNQDIHKTIYKRYRNFCNNLLKKIKLEFDQNEILKAKKNPKATWNVIKKIANLNKKNTNSSKLLQLCDSPSSSVDSVNNFFASVGKNLASKIQSQSRTNTAPFVDYIPIQSTQGSSLPFLSPWFFSALTTQK
ncbi:hypothetical protein OBRU01_06242, partial [Operophtera brumata]